MNQKYLLIGGVVLIGAAIYFSQRKKSEDAPNESLTSLKNESTAAASPSTQFPFEVVSAPRMDTESTAESIGVSADQPWYHEAVSQSLEEASSGGEDAPVIPSDLEAVLEGQA